MFDILVIDDDKNIRFMMSEVLKKAGYNVLLSADGAEGLDLCVDKHVDLVIVDIMMPNMNGYEFTQKLRQVSEDLPVIMVSAKQLPEDRKIGFKVGIDDYMTKPLDTEELLLHVKALLRRYKIVNERKLIVGKVCLDCDSYTVTREEERYELPQKEFMLLYKLLSFPNKIFTRIQLMDDIWGTECETDPETVTVHVGRLRKRFAHFSEFEIVSIRGLGYKAVKK